MSTTEQLIRAYWLTELRRSQSRQCIGASCTPTNACALQLLAEITGDRAYADRFGVRKLIQAAKKAGLSKDQAWKIIDLNDGENLTDSKQRTFTELADIITSWYPNSI